MATFWSFSLRALGHIPNEMVSSERFWSSIVERKMTSNKLLTKLLQQTFLNSMHIIKMDDTESFQLKEEGLLI